MKYSPAQKVEMNNSTVNHPGFDDVKRIYLIMVVIIKKEENVNVCIQVFYDAKV